MRNAPPLLVPTGSRDALRRVRECVFVVVLLTSLSALSVNLPAQDFDESNPRAVATHRFDLALQASKRAREPLPRFLERWLADTPEPEVALLGSMPQAWTGGGEQPQLYRAFVSDSVFESRLDEVLPALETLHQRVPALAAQAPWQSLLARAQLKSGQLPLALASARRASALDARLCARDCPPLVRNWLRTGERYRPPRGGRRRSSIRSTTRAAPSARHSAERPVSRNRSSGGSPKSNWWPRRAALMAS